MPASDPGDAPTDFAGRLAQAISAEKKTQSRTEREARLPQGYIIRLLGTSEKGRARQILNPGPELIRRLAKYLRVSYEWLATGEGSMRPEGWAATAFEQAVLFGRQHGVTELEIELTLARVRTDEGLTAAEWVGLFLLIGRGAAARETARRAERAARPNLGTRRRRGAA